MVLRADPESEEEAESAAALFGLEIASEEAWQVVRAPLRGLIRLCDQHEVRPGRAYPLSYPRSNHELVWKPATALPTGRTDPGGQVSYDDFVAGRTVRSTFATAERV